MLCRSVVYMDNIQLLWFLIFDQQIEGKSVISVSSSLVSVGVSRGIEDLSFQLNFQKVFQVSCYLLFRLLTAVVNLSLMSRFIVTLYC
jgi:hypothetical protein